MTEPSPQRLTRFECAAFMVAMIGVQLSSELFAQWGTYFYSPSVDTGRTVYVAIGLVAIIFMAGRVIDIVTDPLIGGWSDRLSFGSQKSFPRIQGRRRPFIFWGSVCMTLTGVAFWYPPVAEESTTNLVYGTVIMSLHWTMYTLAYIPILALAPEMARTQAERMRLGTWIAVGMIVGLVMAVLLPGVLIAALDPARAVDSAGETQFSAAGYQRVAMLFALISLAAFQWFVWAVRERQENSGAQVEASGRLATNALRVPTFRLYLALFFCFYIGVLANQRAMPYWVELGLGGDESTVSLLGVPFILTSLASALACPLLIRRFSLKRLVMLAVGSIGVSLILMYGVAVMDADANRKLMLAATIYGLNGVGLGVMYVLVTPLIGKLIDEGETLTGARQEGAFNAWHAMMVKFAQVIGIGVAVLIMGQFGNSVDEPFGVFLVAPVGGVFCVVAFVLATRYPEHETK